MATDEVNFDEIKIILDSYSKFLAMFMTWFTWFFGINVAAMAWSITLDSTKIDTKGFYFLCVFMGLCVTFGFIASTTMIIFTVRCNRKIAKLLTLLRTDNRKITKSKILTRYIVALPASVLIMFIMLLTLGAWIYFAAASPHGIWGPSLPNKISN